MANPDRSVYDPPFDDDLMFDAVEEQETARGRPLMILLGIVVALAFAGVVWVAYQQGFQHAESGSAPLLTPAPGPTRVAAAPSAATTAPDNPIYDEMSGNPVSSAPVETPAPPAEEPVAMPPAGPSLSGAPSTAAADPAPDMTVSELPQPSAGPSSETVPPSQAIGSEIAAAPAPRSARAPAVDPLAPGAALPETTPSTLPEPAIEEPAPASAPIGPDPSIAAAAKAERDRLAKEAAAKKAAEARAAEIKRQQLAAAQPPAAPAAPPAVTEVQPAPSATISDPADEAYSPAGAPASPTSRTDASGRPTLLTPPSIDLPPPGSRPSAPPAIASAPPAPAATSDAVPDETPAAAAPASGGFVVQIGAFNSAEEAAASWKRVKQSQGAALAGASPEIGKAEVKGTTKYRLRATGYADRAGAARACDRLKAGGLQCFIAPR